MMKAISIYLPITSVIFATSSFAQVPDEQIEKNLERISPEMNVEKVYLDDDEKKLAFVMRNKMHKNEDAKGIGVILPGGTGSVDFLPFCANVLARRAFPEDWVVVELVAPVWGKMDMNTTVWPSKTFPLRGAKFETEEFIEEAIDEAAKQAIDDAPVVLLPWSSSGHAAISAALDLDDVTGVLLCCSRSLPMLFKPKSGAKGKAFFLYHSPEDRVTIFSDPKAAVEFLPKMGARAKLVTYEGGHGWPQGTDHAANLRAGIDWILSQEEK